MRKVCPDPPTLLRNFLTFFFFSNEPFPKSILISKDSLESLFGYIWIKETMQEHCKNQIFKE